MRLVVMIFEHDATSLKFGLEGGWFAGMTGTVWADNKVCGTTCHTRQAGRQYLASLLVFARLMPDAGGGWTERHFRFARPCTHLEADSMVSSGPQSTACGNDIQLLSVSNTSGSSNCWRIVDS